MRFLFIFFITFLGEFCSFCISLPHMSCTVQLNRVFVKEEKEITLAIGQTESGRDEEARSPNSMRAGWYVTVLT
jgi:hypothetical protein